MTTRPVDQELFNRTAPQWNCVDFPGEGMHYVPDARTGRCAWCGATREQIAVEYDAPEGPHVFSFELWPDDFADYGGRMVPDHTPAIHADTPKQARAYAAELARVRPAPRPGVTWMVGAGSHARGRCTPPHAGVN